MYVRRTPIGALFSLTLLVGCANGRGTQRPAESVRAPIAAQSPPGELPTRPARRNHAPRPAEHVEPAALTAETAAARDTARQRPGSATPFEPALPPVAFRTEDGKEGWKIELGGGRPLATPAVAGAMVYVGGGFGSHEFYAFDAVTGVTRWALRVSDDGPTAAVVADGVVAFNTESCTLFVVDAATGRLLWSRWLGDPLMSQPAIADGKVFMAFPTPQGHRLVAFALRTGQELWRVAVEGDVISAPVAAGDSVFATTFDGTVYRYRMSDGALAWREAFRATSAPWLYDGQVFVSHRELGDAGVPPARTAFVPAPLMLWAALLQVESVGRISGSSGVQSQPAGGYRPRPAPWLNTNVQRQSDYHRAQGASDTSVGFSSTPATARAEAAEANIGQGTVRGLWEYQGSRPCVVDGRLFLTQGDHLVALDPDTGAELWSRPLAGVLATAGGHLASPPAAAGGKLYLATVTGEVVVVGQSDGRVQDTIRVGSPMRFQPSVVGGRLYVGTATGQLLSLDLHDRHADGWPMWGGGAAHNGE